MSSYPNTIGFAGRLKCCLRSLWQHEDGGLVIAEGVIWVVVVVFGCMTTVVTLKAGVADYFRDEVEGVAAASNSFAFDTASGCYASATTTDFALHFPTLGERISVPPTAVPATSESP